MASRLARLAGDHRRASLSLRCAPDHEPGVLPRPERPADGAQDAPCRTGLDGKPATHDPERRPKPGKLRPGLY